MYSLCVLPPLGPNFHIYICLPLLGNWGVQGLAHTEFPDWAWEWAELAHSWGHGAKCDWNRGGRPWEGRTGRKKVCEMPTLSLMIQTEGLATENLARLRKQVWEAGWKDYHSLGDRGCSGPGVLVGKSCDNPAIHETKVRTISLLHGSVKSNSQWIHETANVQALCKL